MQSSNVKRFIVQRYPTYFIMIPLIVGLHIGWFTLQQRYVPVAERHEHPLMKLYKKYITTITSTG
ncbi:unnamed protein product [Lasius platythorax]|uniref:Uncharacterized protein n=1 Tax=Lasius platythorax TaxID=488582 RepID=A0AAV2N7G4_9HYME